MIWVLLGRRFGDNRQVMALAQATGLPWTAKQLAFNRLSGVANILVRASRATLKPEARRELAPPWPRVVIACGSRAAPAALWIKAQSGGRTHLVHLGRPRAPLHWFDLILTTPQYRLPERPNVVENLMTLGSANWTAAALPPEVEALPHPRVGVLAGGSSRPLVFDADAARRLAEEATDTARREDGSVMISTGPRTSAAATAALRLEVERSGLPHLFFPFARDSPGYAWTLAAADRLMVTEDSAAMLAEAATSNAAVSVFPLERQPDWRMRVTSAIQRVWAGTPGVRRSYYGLIRAGIVSPSRDLVRYRRRLGDAGLLDAGGGARARACAELEAAAERVRRLCDVPPS